MSMKKFYLTNEWRDRIVNDLLAQNRKLDEAMASETQSETIRDLAEQAKQERNMLVDLLKVTENERL